MIPSESFMTCIYVRISPYITLYMHACTRMHTHVLHRLAGTGIRLEDDVLLTESGCEVLNRDCPETIDNITAIVGTASNNS